MYAFSKLLSKFIPQCAISKLSASGDSCARLSTQSLSLKVSIVQKTPYEKKMMGKLPGYLQAVTYCMYT